MTLKKLSAAEFKTHCLSVMDEVSSTRQPVLITKRGRPAAKLVPPDDAADDFTGPLECVVRIVSDIESPIEPPESWEALRWSCWTLTHWYGPSPSQSGSHEPR